MGFIIKNDFICRCFNGIHGKSGFLILTFFHNMMLLEFGFALIMHQHLGVANIIRMKLLNLKVINRDRTFKQLMLNLFDNDVFSVDGDEDISCAELTRRRPTLYGRVEGVLARADDRFAVDGNVDKLGGFVSEKLNDALQFGFARFGIGCPYKVSGFDLFNGNVASSVLPIKRTEIASLSGDFSNCFARKFSA